MKGYTCRRGPTYPSWYKVKEDDYNFKHNSKRPKNGINEYRHYDDQFQLDTNSKSDYEYKICHGNLLF